MTIEGKIIFLLRLLLFPCLTFIISLFLTRFSIKMLRRNGFVAEMGSRHIHKKVIPTAGGIGMIAAFAFSSIVYNLWVKFFNTSPEIKLIPYDFFLPAMMLFFIGIYDDRFGMRAIIKLCGQIAAALLAWYCDIRLECIFGFMLPDYASCAATILWFLIFINAFNLIDGLDGLASGLAVLAGLTMAAVLMISHQWTAAIMAISVAAACLGFLRYNFHPAKLFMGDTGSMFLGYVLAAIGLITSNLNTSFFAILIPAMACGVPLIDTALAVWRRSTFKILKKQSWREIMSADRSHLHHRILDAYHGNQSRTAILIYILALLISTVGIVSSIIVDTLPMLAVLLIVITLIIVLRKFAVVEIYNSTEIVFKGLAIQRRGVFLNILHPVYDLIVINGSFFLAIILFENNGNERDFLYRTVISALILTLSMAFCRIYRIYWLRAGVIDYLRLAYSITLGFIIVLVVNIVLNKYCGTRWSLILLLPTYLMVMMLILGERIHLRSLQLIMSNYYRASWFNKNSVPIILFGASEQINAYSNYSSLSYNKRNEKIVGIIDNDIALHGLDVYGYRVLGNLNMLESIYQQKKFCKIVVTASKVFRIDHEIMTDFCRKNQIELSFFNIAEENEPKTLHENPNPPEEE